MATDVTSRVAAEHAIAEHLRKLGPREWNRVRSKFPEIPKATWFRMVARIKAAPPASKELKAARRAVRGKAKADLLQAMESQAPARAPLPSPGHIVKSGERALRDLDFVAEAQKLYAEAEALRDQSVAHAADGSLRITSPRSFTKSMTVRRDLIETCLKIVERAYDVEQTRRFYDALIAELRDESPELVERVAARMAATNNRWGLAVGLFG
jgi:hypothetical protein